MPESFAEALRDEYKDMNNSSKNESSKITEDEMIQLAVEACESKLEEEDLIPPVVHEIASEHNLMYCQREIYEGVIENNSN